MAITNFIPTIWSENLYKALDKQYIAVANCSREFEGDIKSKGSTVNICGVGRVNVSDYTKNTDMNNPQQLSDTCTSLVIDQAKYFNFQIDDVDRAQSTPKLMDAAMNVAANSLASDADQYVLALYNQSDNIIRVTDPTAESIMDAVISAREFLYNNNVVDNSSVVIEVSPRVATLLLKAKMALSTDNTAILENGCIGTLFGCKVFVSNNITIDGVEGYNDHKCLMRTKRAIAFAEQLSEIEAYRPEKRFADAVKGLHLFGAGIIYPNEMVVLDIGFAQED